LLPGSYRNDKCPTSKTEQGQAKRVIKERLRRDRAEKDKLTRDMEEWLEEREP